MSKMAPPMFNPAAEHAAFNQALAGLEVGESDLAGVGAEAKPNSGFLGLGKTKFTRTLTSGTSGDDVKTAQKKLAALGYGVPVSGTYGSSTESAVRQFQQAQDLPVTGKVDQVTWDLLQKKGGGSQTLQAFTDAFSFTSSAAPGIISAITGPTEEVAVYEEIEEPETDWLLIGGLAVGGVVLFGGLAWLVSR